MTTFSSKRFRRLSLCITMALSLIVGVCAEADARSTKRLPLTQAIARGEASDDRLPTFATQRGAAAGADTLSFGYVDSEGFAVLGETWTFDHGDTDPFEGWTATDVTANDTAYFRQISDGIWNESGAEVDAPVLSGAGSIWCGAFESEADALCWEGGLGYGNNWSQRLSSPVLSRALATDVTLDFSVFYDLEDDFEFLTVLLRTLPSEQETELAQFTGQGGLSPSHPSSPPTGTQFNTTILDEFFTDETDFQIVFRMTSDGAWSDEDGFYPTEYGPLSLDDIILDDGVSLNVAYTFETDLDGWSPEVEPGVGSFMGVANKAEYVFGSECGAHRFAGDLLEFHDDNHEHPYGQRIQALSPPVNVLEDVPEPVLGELQILADWEQYSEQPRANGVFHRPGWDYYPFICPGTGETQWSGRVGQATFFSTGDDPVAFSMRNIATDNGIPGSVEQIRFIFEIYASCDAFAIGPEECTESTNFTPLIDNIQIRFTIRPKAPRLSYDPGDRYTDGFSQSVLLDPNRPGNANTVINTSYGNNTPIINGDSLRVAGPIPSSGFEYDTRLWFRVGRKGPGSNTSGYDAWRARVQQSGGLDAVDSVTNIESGAFATAKMDSSQLGTNAYSNRFESYFIEEDARFDAGAGERTDGNEIIADGVLLPGTKIEYFVSSNYVVSPEEIFLLPDTTGGFFSEFEILPRWTAADGILKFPALLYIDAHNRGAQFYIESAFDALGLVYDRYDYLDAASNWKAPLARGLTSEANNGISVFQLLGYRGILINTGDLAGNVMWPEDFAMCKDWLETISCHGSQIPKALLINGDNAAQVLHHLYPNLLNGNMAARFSADSYRDESSPSDENYCVHMEALELAGEFGTRNSFDVYEYDAFGNGCPDKFDFDVLATLSSGVGNRAYVNVETGNETHFAQIVNESGSNDDNYRTILDGVSWHHLSERDDALGCVADSAHIVSAAINEIAASLEWAFDTAAQHIPIPEWGDDPCNNTSGVDPVSGSYVTTQLFQNRPNPFNPRTLLRFSLAADGPVELSIFDVQGRKIRTLHNEEMKAGAYEVVWDGTDDEGAAVSTGVYWSQLDATGWVANKKMILVR